MQIKTTMRYHLTPVRMALIKKAEHETYWQMHKEKGILIYFDGNGNQYSHYGKRHRVLLKKKLKRKLLKFGTLLHLTSLSR